MRISRCTMMTTIAACSAIAAVLLSSSSFAQSGLEQQKQMSDQIPTFSGDKSSIDPILQENGIDTSKDTTTLTSATALVDPYKAEAEPLTLLNCSTASVNVKTFNSNDAALWVPFQTVGIGKAGWGGLKCATRSCKLIVQGNGVKTGALSGYQVYVGGKVSAGDQPSGHESWLQHLQVRLGSVLGCCKANNNGTCNNRVSA